MELVRSALAAAVEALPPAARFGLVSFGSKVPARAARGQGRAGQGMMDVRRKCCTPA